MARPSIVILSVATVLFNLNLHSRNPYSVNYGIYDFLDELANHQIISVNSAVRPFPSLIYQNCEDADRKGSAESKTVAELEFYLRFGKEINGTTCEEVQNTIGEAMD